MDEFIKFRNFDGEDDKRVESTDLVSISGPGEDFNGSLARARVTSACVKGWKPTEDGEGCNAGMSTSGVHRDLRSMAVSRIA